MGSTRIVNLLAGIAVTLAFVCMVVTVLHMLH